MAIIDEYINEMNEATSYNKRINEIFAAVPEMSPDLYQKTAFLYANKKYEEELSKDEPIPHGFYQILEDSIRKQGFLPTLRIYNDEIQLICETLNIEINTFRNILKTLRPSNSKSVSELQEEQKARQKLKQIFRKFNSVFKENYIKDIVEEKMIELQKTIIEREDTGVKRVLTPEGFVNNIFSNNVILKKIRALFLDKFFIIPSDALLTTILLATTKKNYSSSIIKALNLVEPEAYQRYLVERHINRLESNFGPKLELMCQGYSEEDKMCVYKIIQYQCKCYGTSSAHDNDAFLAMKTLIKKANISLLQNIAKLMVKSGTQLELKNGKFSFVFPTRVTVQEKIECEKYHSSQKAVKSVHNILYNLYKDQNDLLLEFMNKAKTNIPDENTAEVDKSKWLNVQLMKKLIDKIDTNKIKRMPEKIFNALKKLLVKDGLLWVYLAGNIKMDMVLKIINNFESIYASMAPNKINIDNIQELFRKANLYDYVDDYMIALIGLDNLSKIINYNQFLGVPVTDEIILKRLRKVIDLAERTETINRSSLPFTCDIETDNYRLMRYHNNDPAIFTSGIDTKTCFSVGVNENDFFFYSLLNKDGYVIKITDKSGKLIARASCFRKNNVLMINGIRTRNNKVVPENQEELQLFKDLVELIKLMAKKMIAITSGDECPIDYVVCNQAGILEHALFEDKFEKVNPQLFKEPINVYSDDWDSFVHMYDNAKEQLLQEVPYNPEHSFTTDFGNHYPALLIESRGGMGLLSPRDISISDQTAIYERPRKNIVEYIGEEINENILAVINRIRALDYHRMAASGQQMNPFRLLTNVSFIEKVCIGDDWCIIVGKNGKRMAYYAKINNFVLNEANQYAQTLRDKEDKDVKLYILLDKNSKKNS